MAQFVGRIVDGFRPHDITDDVSSGAVLCPVHLEATKENTEIKGQIK